MQHTDWCLQTPRSGKERIIPQEKVITVPLDGCRYCCCGNRYWTSAQLAVRSRSNQVIKRSSSHQSPEREQGRSHSTCLSYQQSGEGGKKKSKVLSNWCADGRPLQRQESAVQGHCSRTCNATHARVTAVVDKEERRKYRGLTVRLHWREVGWFVCKR